MNNISNFIRNNIKLLTIISFVFIIIIIGLIIIFAEKNNDGMSNEGILKINYRTYTNYWNKYSKNGVTSGNKKDFIKDIDIKIDKTNKGSLFYEVYTDKWSDQINDYTQIGTEINGIKIGLSDTLYRKYDVCYRTYNNKDKWLNWTCNFTVSGNIDKTITAIEIKVIPKNSIKFDYLKDYNEQTTITSIGFDKE